MLEVDDIQHFLPDARRPHSRSIRIPDVSESAWRAAWFSGLIEQGRHGINRWGLPRQIPDG